MHSPVVASPDLESHPAQMAEALRSLQHAVTQCMEAVFITDATGIITRVNPAFEELTGYASLEIVGKDLSTITDGGNSPEYRHIWRNAYEEKQYAGPLKLRSSSGELVAVEVRVTPVLASRGRMTGLVGTGRRLGSVVVAPPRVQVAAMDARLLRLFHDLRNMLMLVLAHADFAREAMPPDHPSRRHMENAKNAARSAAALVHDFAKTEESVPGRQPHTATTHSSRLLENSNAPEPGALEIWTK
jgi:PAS domain S-box-containing protein